MFKGLKEYFTIKKSGLFEPEYYLLNYPDVRGADIDPLKHFVKIGAREFRNPNPFFNTKYYVDRYIDVDNSGTNPLIHYILHGEKEGRWPNPGFDPEYYLSENPDIKAAGVSPLLHYLKIGKNECRKTKQNKEEFTAANTVGTENYQLGEIKINPPKGISNVYSLIIEDEIEQYPEKVSVIIPTLNAGNDFAYLLKMLKNQKGINEIELIIVDSGSSDNTIKIAAEYGARVINIWPEEFSHSFARNLGAENASGDYFLFTVQDALPPTDLWLYELLTCFKNNDISAVSCAESPREDADLFYRVNDWNHYNFIGVNGKDRIFKLPEIQNYLNLRQNAQLSDIACLLPREVFREYKYRLNYAEDLDLGIRLIKDGKKIAFLGSTKIIHSHNRSAYYFLKRGYVDNLTGCEEEFTRAHLMYVWDWLLGRSSPRVSLWGRVLIIVAQGRSLGMWPCPLDRDSNCWIARYRWAMVYYL